MKFYVPMFETIMNYKIIVGFWSRLLQEIILFFLLHFIKKFMNCNLQIIEHRKAYKKGDLGSKLVIHSLWNWS